MKRREKTAEELLELENSERMIGEESLRDEVQPIYYTTDDEKLLQIMQQNPRLNKMRALASRLMRLTKITEKEKDVLCIDIDLIMGTMEADMDEDDFDSGDWAELNSCAVVLKTTLNDSVKGFKMTLLSRIRKEIAVSREEAKRRGWFR